MQNLESVAQKSLNYSTRYKRGHLFVLVLVLYSSSGSISSTDYKVQTLFIQSLNF